MFVLDCSVAAAFLFEDEASPATDALLARLKVEGAIVPTLWSLELGNMLVQAERRRRTRSTRLTGILDLVRRLPIVTDSETDERALREIFALARQEGLTTYDASYLELAMRRNVDLATRDKQLIQAANRVGVATIP